jgi:FAD/FMN-containing dehydrogenase
MGPTFHPDDTVVSWGRVARGRHDVASPRFRGELKDLTFAGQPPLLVAGLRRSYGTSGLNRNGRLLDATGLDRLIAFDERRGVLKAEAGLSLDALLRFAVPRGWFLPVTPGTRFVTLGGAVANDVHGKNHHVAGPFGRHVQSLGLRRSTGETMIVSPTENEALFAATVGGLGLTGIIEWVELALIRIESAWLDVETLIMPDLQSFFDLAHADNADWPYTVAWIDCMATGAAIGRGIYTRGRFRADGALDVHRSRQPSVPFDAPGFLLNRLSVSTFNRFYAAWQARKVGIGRQHYAPFFYPLDGIGQWNRLYGPRGFLQYQCIVPPEVGPAAIKALLERIARSGEGSFLAVLKTFGDCPSPGLLSFPMPGATLALDFANHGARTLNLMADLDTIVTEAGGRLYPAKDGRMSAQMFAKGYGTALDRFLPHVDPAFSSDFWRQVQPVEPHAQPVKVP